MSTTRRDFMVGMSAGALILLTGRRAPWPTA